jgi:hypothetical protein
MTRKPSGRKRLVTLPTALEYSSTDSVANSRQSVVIITSYNELQPSAFCAASLSFISGSVNKTLHGTTARTERRTRSSNKVSDL